jgi:hypothetical protein
MHLFSFARNAADAEGGDIKELDRRHATKI